MLQMFDHAAAVPTHTVDPTHLAYLLMCKPCVGWTMVFLGSRNRLLYVCSASLVLPVANYQSLPAT